MMRSLPVAMRCVLCLFAVLTVSAGLADTAAALSALLFSGSTSVATPVRKAAKRREKQSAVMVRSLE